MRIFIALTLPQNAIEMLCAVQKKLKESGSGGRPIEKKNIHITLRFLGEISEQMASNVCAVVKEDFAHTPAPLISMDGVGAFIRSGGDNVYAHLGGNFEEIVDIYKSMTKTLQNIGLQPELRPFTPHITLMRGAEFGSKMLNAHSEPFFCKSICVFSSKLRPEGSQYETLQEIILSR